MHQFIAHIYSFFLFPTYHCPHWVSYGDLSGCSLPFLSISPLYYQFLFSPTHSQVFYFLYFHIGRRGFDFLRFAWFLIEKASIFVPLEKLKGEFRFLLLKDAIFSAKMVNLRNKLTEAVFLFKFQVYIVILQWATA